MPQDAVADSFLAALAAARHEAWPYPHWFLESALPGGVVDAIAGLPYAPPGGAAFSGKRETNNATRVYFNAEAQAEHPVCARVADAFKAPRVISAIETATGANLSDGQLRIEYCQDTDGFWLEPHTDISVKLFTMLIYLSGEPELRDAGTDIYDASPEHRKVGTAPYEKNKGLIFIPGDDTWHGFSKRPIAGVRKSIIVNYVTPDWRDRWELA